jgi:hypothetical protein
MFKKALVLTSMSVTLALPSAALARGISAFEGVPSNASEASCWGHSVGAVVNNCSTAKRWCVPLPIDVAGNYNVRVYAYGPSSSSNVGCFATGTNPEATWTWGSPQTYLTTFGSDQPINLTGAYLPVFGALYACCDVGPGAWVDTVSWWQ